MTPPPASPPPALWGDETRRSMRFFAIGQQRMPLALIHAMAEIKASAAQVNGELGLLPNAVAQAVADAAAEVAGARHDAQFPLSVWQTGSGAQSHTNLNEVIAARVLARHPELGARVLDQVNLGQSAHDVFPSALQIAAALALRDELLPALHELRLALAAKAVAWTQVTQLGRTALQDAAPPTLGQEFGAYEAQLAHCEAEVRASQAALHRLPLGAGGVGPRRFGPVVIARLAERLGLPLSQAPSLQAALTGHEAIVSLHAALRALAITLTRIAHEIRLLGRGSRAGPGEWLPPPDEGDAPVPTQVDAVTMVCAQVIGHDAAIGIAASRGQFQLNAYQPLIGLNLLDSLQLLADAMHSFSGHGVRGLQVQARGLPALPSAPPALVTGLASQGSPEHTAQLLTLTLAMAPPKQ